MTNLGYKKEAQKIFSAYYFSFFANLAVTLVSACYVTFPAKGMKMLLIKATVTQQCCIKINKQWQKLLLTATMMQQSYITT